MCGVEDKAFEQLCRFVSVCFRHSIKWVSLQRLCVMFGLMSVAMLLRSMQIFGLIKHVSHLLFNRAVVSSIGACKCFSFIHSVTLMSGFLEAIFKSSMPPDLEASFSLTDVFQFLCVTHKTFTHGRTCCFRSRAHKIISVTIPELDRATCTESVCSMVELVIAGFAKVFSRRTPTTLAKLYFIGASLVSLFL